MPLILVALGIDPTVDPVIAWQQTDNASSREVTTKGGTFRSLLHAVQAPKSASSDCNNNGINDEEEIETCNGSPACDDCNLTDLPDECDIALGTSVDLDLNGVPDECVFFDGGGADDHWNTDSNWDDDIYPDNQNQTETKSANVESFIVSLNEEVEIDTLRLLDGAILEADGLTAEDIKIEKPGGLQIRSVGPVSSSLRLGSGRQIDASAGLVHVQTGGLIEASVASPAAGTVLAAELLIDTRCGSVTPGQVKLTGTMMGDISGNVTIDGLLGCAVCALCPTTPLTASGFVAGGETPPILLVSDSAGLHVGGNLVLRGAVALSHTSTQPLVIAGSFVNEGTCPNCVTLTGPIVLGSNYFSATAGLALQTFEVSALDRGPDPNAFTNSMSAITIADGAFVTFQNQFVNQSIDEVLYVDTLTLGAGSEITISGCTVYYKSLVDNGGSIAFAKGGELTKVSTPAIPAVSTWGLAALTMLTLVAATLLIRNADSGADLSRRTIPVVKLVYAHRFS